MNKERYEDIALILYGYKMSVFAAFLIIVNLLGVVIAYIVLIKALIPQTIESMSNGGGSRFIKNEILWATIVSVSKLASSFSMESSSRSRSSEK